MRVYLKISIHVFSDFFDTQRQIFHLTRIHSSYDVNVLFARTNEKGHILFHLLLFQYLIISVVYLPYLFLSKYKPYRAYVNMLVYSTLKKSSIIPFC